MVNFLAVNSWEIVHGVDAGVLLQSPHHSLSSINFSKHLCYASRVKFLRNSDKNMEFFLYVSEQNKDSDESKHLLKIFDLIKDNTKQLYSEFFAKNLVLKEVSIYKFKKIVIDSIFDKTLFSKIGCFEYDISGKSEQIRFCYLPYVNYPDNPFRDYIRWVVQDIKSPNETDIISGLENSLNSETIARYTKHLEPSYIKFVADELRSTPKSKGKIRTIIIVFLVGGVVGSIIVAVIYKKKKKENFDEDPQEVKQFQ